MVLQSGTNPTLDVVRFVGETVVFECDLGARIMTGSVVQWSTRSGLDLPLERVVFADSNTTLIITDLMYPIDRDGYVCIVTLPDGVRNRVTYDLIINRKCSIAIELL